MPREPEERTSLGATGRAVTAKSAVDGDDPQFTDTRLTEFVGRWRHQVTQACLRLTGNPQDAEDAAQEAFARALAARNTFQGEAAFSTWFWRIAINAAHDLRRKRMRRHVAGHPDPPPEPATDPATDPLQQALAAERRDRILQALSELSDLQRTVIVLRHYERMKFREIAEVLDVPVGTVASRMADALSRLAQLLNSETDED